MGTMLSHVPAPFQRFPCHKHHQCTIGLPIGLIVFHWIWLSDFQYSLTAAQLSVKLTAYLSLALWQGHTLPRLQLSQTKKKRGSMTSFFLLRNTCHIYKTLKPSHKKPFSFNCMHFEKVILFLCICILHYLIRIVN